MLHRLWPDVVTAAGNEINTNIFHMEMLYHCRSLAGEMANSMGNIGLAFVFMCLSTVWCICIPILKGVQSKSKPLYSGSGITSVRYKRSW